MKCPKCKGTGFIAQEVGNGLEVDECPRCNGTGKEIAALQREVPSIGRTMIRQKHRVQTNRRVYNRNAEKRKVEEDCE